MVLGKISAYHNDFVDFNPHIVPLQIKKKKNLQKGYGDSYRM